MLCYLAWVVFRAVTHFFSSVSSGEWLLFLAELLVGAVIYMEVEHSTKSSFLAKAASETSDKHRRSIYKAFLELPGTKEQKKAAFQAELAKNDSEGECLRTAVNNTLSMFNELGFELNRWFSLEKYRRSGRGLISIFPHSAVCFWYIAGPFVRGRREITGPWFAQHALTFIKWSIDYVLRYVDHIGMALPGFDEEVVLDRRELERMRSELIGLMAQHRSI